MGLRILTLFDGVGLARLGLEQAGHECLGVEIDPSKHFLSSKVGSGNCVLGDAVSFVSSFGANLSKHFDAVWASPPCQSHSRSNLGGTVRGSFGVDLLQWSLQIKSDILWVENVKPQFSSGVYGKLWNAAQFEETPRQNRTRIIGGNYIDPIVFREYKSRYNTGKNAIQICPTITATEYKGCAGDRHRASRYYGRKLTIEECAYHQGFTIPSSWYDVPDFFTRELAKSQFDATRETGWKYNLYEGIGNAVPTYLSKAFGVAHAS